MYRLRPFPTRRLRTAAFPEPVTRELLRINQDWYRNGIPEWLPYHRETGETALPVDMGTPPGLFEQAMECHRRQAVEELARYQKEPTRARAKQVARHMMYANLASQCFNQAFGQDPLKDLPFPID
jgi:hypothetical protein